MKKRSSLDRWIVFLLVLTVVIMAVMTVLVAKLYLDYRKMAQPEPVPPSAPHQVEVGPVTQKNLSPPRTGKLLDERGSPRRAEDWQGQPTLFLFWSSWCEDCEGLFRSGYRELAQKAKESGLELVLVCREGVRGDTQEKARQALDKYGIQDPLWMDPEAAFYHSFGLRSVPSMALLDEQGRLVCTSQTIPSASLLEQMGACAAQGPLEQTWAFVQTLMEGDGGLPSSYHLEQGRLVGEGSYLSETQGLFLMAALGAGDQNAFDRAWKYTQETLRDRGLYAWQRLNGENQKVNASLDDLRIIHALSLADAKWGGYGGAAQQNAAVLYDSVVADGIMTDFADLKQPSAGTTATLCYQDVAAMEAAAQWDPRWETAAQQAAQLLEGGLISEQFPLYYPQYNLEAKKYTGDFLQMNEALVTVLHAAQAGLVRTETLDWLEETMAQGPLYGAYTVKGKAAHGYEYESTASYALVVQIAIQAQRPSLARLALARMENARCFTPPMVGGYGNVKDHTLYSFDPLQALLALQAARACPEG